MDVVARGIERLRGSISLDSKPGAGTTVTIRLPAQLAVRQALVARSGGTLVCVPLERLERIDRVGDSAESTIAAEFVDSRELLGGPRLDPRSCPTLILATAAQVRLALGVEAIEGVGELVVKPLDPLLSGHPIIDGCAVSGSGEVVFALDIDRLRRPERPVRADSGGLPPNEVAGRFDAVLVVDDSLSVRNRSAKRFRELGLRVDEAGNGLEALELIRKRRYQMVLTDLEMPKMDGITLLSELAAAPAEARSWSSPALDPTSRPNTAQKASAPTPSSQNRLTTSPGAGSFCRF